MSERGKALERRLEGASVEVTIAVMANEFVNMRDDLDEMKDTLKWVGRSLFGLALTIIAGLIIFYVSHG